jgi:hypothetical protein
MREVIGWARVPLSDVSDQRKPKSRPGQLAAIGRVTRREPHSSQHVPTPRIRIQSFCATSLRAARDKRSAIPSQAEQRFIESIRRLMPNYRLRA